MDLYQHVQDIVLHLLRIPGCRPTSIGGSIRDTLWETYKPEVKDADLEVFGATDTQILEALKGRYELDLVGKQFGVLKVKGHPIDISLPRLESCTGMGHKDFSVQIDPTLTPEQAALRRDFTINAVSFDWQKYLGGPGTEEHKNSCYIDPYGGRADIKARILRPISSKFEEDPVRPLRAMQFIARFDLIATPELISRCAAMKDKVAALPKERVQEEWNKLILKGKKMSSGLNFLVSTGLIDLYPELKALIGVPQHEVHHAEGDCWIHTCRCMDGYAATKSGTNEDELVTGYAVLCHDLGKATTTKVNPDTGNWCAHGHETASVPLARKFMERMFAPEQDIIKMVEKLAATHMTPVRLMNDKAKMPAFRRLSLAVDGRIDLLKRVVDSDRLGCGNGKMFTDELLPWMDQQVEACNIKLNQGPKPIIMGQHLIDHFSLKPGREFGPILAQAFEAQLDGKFTDEVGGIEFIRLLLSQKAP